MASKMADFILVLFVILLSATTILSFDITKLLREHGDFSTFNEFLTQAGVATEVNSRQTITVFAVDNSAMGSITSKPREVITKILATHVVLDYFDTNKLADFANNKQATLTNLFQTTGNAVGQQGFLKVSKSGSDIIVGSAADNAPQSAKVLNSIVSEPYSISVLHISQPIMTPGIDQIAPSGAPKVESPADAHKAESPADAHKVESPTDAHKVGSPVEAHKVESPTDAHKVESPAEAHKVGSPTDAHKVESPAEAHKVGSPTDAHKVESPAEAHKVGSPTDAHKVESPAEAHKVESPTDAHKVESPAEGHKVESPAEGHSPKNAEEGKAPESGDSTSETNDLFSAHSTPPTGGASDEEPADKKPSPPHKAAAARMVTNFAGVVLPAAFMGVAALAL